ncbi:MAG: hypothetical protein K2G32_01800 [Oscillospiraceae bacterium]|nr:hypothetical protein [Oscillospiraceae bacterium]
MKKYKVGAIVFGILLGMMAITFISIISTESLTSAKPVGILCIFLAIGMIANIVMRKKTSDPNVVAAMEAKRVLAYVTGTLVDGLPIPAAVAVTANLYNERVDLIAAAGKKRSECQYFNLDIEKIQKVIVLNEQQIQQIVTQSAPGMIIGAAAFGLLGAMVGGRVKTKEKTKLKFILLIEYISDSETKQILLNTGEDSSQAYTFANRFHKIKPQTNQTIQL